MVIAAARRPLAVCETGFTHHIHCKAGSSRGERAVQRIAVVAAAADRGACRRSRARFALKVTGSQP